MTDLLLHPSLIVEILGDASDARPDSIVRHARSRGDGVWLPLAAVPSIIHGLSEAADVNNSEARERLKTFGDKCTWLGSPAGDAAFLAFDDMIEQQVRRGLDRLGPGALLLSLEGGERATTLEDYLESPDRPDSVAFIDLALQQRMIRDRVEDGLLGVLAHGRYIGGPEIEELESRLARYVGVRHAVAVSNGTDALLIALMAAGVRAGDEVVTSPFTFAATGEMIHLLGARPVYVDIDPTTYNLDPTRLAEAISDRTRLILPVSIFGQCADMEEIESFARERGVRVIEDAAQSFGATYKERRSGSLGDIGCTSFFPSKPLGGYGDSGACFTDDDDLADALRQIRDHGQTGRYHHTRLGLNGRMSSFQASVLLAKLSLFEDEVRLRAEVASRYDALFAERSKKLEEGDLVVPHVRPGNTSVYAQYSLLVRDRDRVQRRLGELGVPSAVHYPVPLNRQPAMADPACRLPVCEDVSARVLSIPMHPYLGKVEQERVVEAVIDAMARD